MKKPPRHILSAALLLSAGLHLLAYGSLVVYLGWPNRDFRPGEGEGAEIFIEVGLLEPASVQPPPPPLRERVPDRDKISAVESEVGVALLTPPDLSGFDGRKPDEDSLRPPAAAAGRAGRAETTAGPAVDDYLHRVRRRIEAVSYYPRRARISRLAGAVRVGFRIDPGGVLRDPRLLEPSTHQLFNRAALEILERAAPFPKPVGGIEGSLISVSISFESTY